MRRECVGGGLAQPACCAKKDGRPARAGAPAGAQMGHKSLGAGGGTSTGSGVAASAVRPTLCTFWIGPRLPNFHNLCMRSWLAMGHPVKFFSYEPVANVPDGVELRDAADVYPRERLDDPALRIPLVIKSDIWRLAMLQRGEGIWTDTDVLLLRPMPMPGKILQAVEHHGLPSISVLWWPADHPALKEILAVFDRLGLGRWAYAKPVWNRFLGLLTGRPPAFADYPWNHWGRHAFQYFTRKYGLRGELLGSKSFFPPQVYDRSLFVAKPFRHLLDDPEVIGLHCFFKEEGAFEAAPEGSLIHWAKARYS